MLDKAERQLTNVLYFIKNLLTNYEKSITQLQLQLILSHYIYKLL